MWTGLAIKREVCSEWRAIASMHTCEATTQQLHCRNVEELLHVFDDALHILCILFLRDVQALDLSFIFYSCNEAASGAPHHSWEAVYPHFRAHALLHHGNRN